MSSSINSQSLLHDDARTLAASPSSTLPRQISLTISEARQEAKTCSQDIFSTWKVLHAMLERHENLIRCRWGKKSQAKRRKVIDNAWPNMSATHRPDYKAAEEAIRQHGQFRFQLLKQNRDAFLCPYINVEDLVQGKSLLQFLHSRGRTLPEAFANSDFNATNTGRACDAINPRSLHQHTMLLHGQTTPETYGQILPWEGNDEAFQLLMQGIGTQPGDGLLVMEVQLKILRFLVKCAQLILADIPADALVNEQTPIKPDPGPVPTDPTAWPSLAALSMEAPYRVPASLDFQRLAAVISAKYAAAKDHLWAMKEDPGYFAKSVMDYGAHRLETIPDAKGRKHPRLNTPYFWDLVLYRVVVSAYEQMFTWEPLYQQVLKVVALKEQLAPEISAKKVLPAGYMNALLYLKFLTHQATRGAITDLAVKIPPSPLLQQCFLREPYDPTSPTELSIKLKESKDKKVRKLMAIFATLHDTQPRSLPCLSYLMDEFGVALQDHSQKSLVSPLVAEGISELSVLVVCLRQLDLYQPWASHMAFDVVDDREDFKTLWEQAGHPYRKLTEALKVVTLADLGTPSDGFFHYPIDRHTTRATTEAMRKAEHRLDAFWQRIDDHIADQKPELQGFWNSFFSGKERVLRRTPEWVEELAEVSAEALYVPLPQSLGSDKDTAHLTEAEKFKAKTRGIARPSATDSVEPDRATIDHVETETKLAVSKRALKVFSVLFFTPSAQGSMPGEVPWSEFLHAMASAGFAAEKLYGSVWQFTPVKLDAQASIQFHEPHPHGKLSFATARRIGRRLDRAYGWSVETFTSQLEGT